MKPAEQLTGMTLANGWKVEKMVTRPQHATGGHHSTGYHVANADGRRGFLKAMDYTEALGAPNSPDIMRAYVDAYIFERDVCLACRDRRMSRVVHAIDHGSIQMKPKDLASKVEYLIFERADNDVRLYLDAQAAFDAAFIMRTVHNVATAMNQLHMGEMAHQDLKPSNVLVFHEAGAKVCDLGRAWSKALRSPFDNVDIPGQAGYAPPEQLYGVPRDGSADARYASDLYHLGSLIVFFFTSSNVNGLLMAQLPPDLRPVVWTGSFTDVLPALYNAFGLALQGFEASVPEYLKPDLLVLTKALCDPEPSKREHPTTLKHRESAESASKPRSHSLERFISSFNLLADRASLQYRKSS